MGETSETITLKMWVRTDIVGSKVEFTVEKNCEDWQGMDDIERDKMMFEELCLSGQFEWGYKEIDSTQTE